MPVSKLARALRDHHVINTWDVLMKFAPPELRVAVQYKKGNGRAVSNPRSQVWKPGVVTDPTAAWYDHGNKTFLGVMDQSLPAAIAWASGKYGIKDWVPCPTDPMCTKIPKAVREAAERWVEAADEVTGTMDPVP
jgi:hypothetical protein